VRLLGVEQIGRFAVRGETIDFTEEIAGLGDLWGSGGSTGRLYMSPKRDRPTRTRLLEVSAGSRTAMTLACVSTASSCAPFALINRGI
jgi:hypothetical protein